MGWNPAAASKRWSAFLMLSSSSIMTTRSAVAMDPPLATIAPNSGSAHWTQGQVGFPLRAVCLALEAPDIADAHEALGEPAELG